MNIILHFTKSSLSPAIAYFYMKHFDQTALNTATHKGDKLSEFLSPLRNVHRRTQFTIEYDKDQSIFFLNVVSRKPDVNLKRTNEHTYRSLFS